MTLNRKASKIQYILTSYVALPTLCDIIYFYFISLENNVSSSFLGIKHFSPTCIDINTEKKQILFFYFLFAIRRLG